MPTSKLVYLEYYRGFAALGVASAHYYALMGSPPAEFFAIFLVEMFFPLSGFVLAGQILKIHSARRHFKTFLYRRWMRTLPAFFLALAAAIMVTGQADSLWDVVKYVFFLNFFFPAGYSYHNYYTVAWSLAVEEYYYLIFPLFIFLFKGSLIRKTLYFIAVSFMAKLVGAFFFEASYLRIATYMRLDAIAIGFAVRLLTMEGRAFGNRTLVFLLGASGMALLPASYWHYDVQGRFSLLCLLYAAALFFGFACLALSRMEQTRPIRSPFLINTGLFMGRISYSAYLFHPILMIVAKSQGWSFPVYLLCVILLSYAIYKYFEAPILQHRPDYR